ncbi:fam-b protein [Plasmodium berghei]|uniref:Fam-b protein n=2 Tax=Plasmodium berghei TaxID=5821 RepID=A0A509AG63_PLABA|nr:fam-b protein [Plasmodium berghei ANKA]CXI22308.1 fam-b protein [Plasmodium berghei]SBW38273.1 fam-b protein [Plasmodium berghei]SCL83353.1 fam-b protein [Plasmodium berghei]SCL86040.1 fam-b protein [Plasmodium berghei]VUC54928.1 fam-b protein [Plasmodium berghei ANKA]|eukprot:XP_034420748.1 fam-b protein [Plasmodium berghei ANKA]
MRVSILKYVLFSIVICSFEYGKNELYLVNDRNICLEMNVINFRNNRILADADNEFDLNGFYQSTLNLANQLGDCIEGNKEIEYLINIIDSHIKKHKESNTSLDLKNVDSKTKTLIKELRKELEELKKHISDKTNGELSIQLIDDKIIIKKDENGSVSEHEDFKQLKNNENNKIASSNRHTESELIKKYRKEAIKLILSCLAYVAVAFSVSIGGSLYLTILFLLPGLSICYFLWRFIKYSNKLEKVLRFRVQGLEFRVQGSKLYFY